MEIFRPELHSFPLRAFLDEARDTLGEERLSELLKSYGLQAEDFLDASAWVSLEFVESLFQALVDGANDPEFVDRATLRGMSPRYIGALYPLFRAFGSPRFTYNQLARAAGRVNKTGQWLASGTEPGRIEMRWIPRPGAAQEAKPFICRTRQLQLGQIPALFDLPIGTVTHPQCVLRGDTACVYYVQWEESAPQRQPLFAGALGGAFGAAIAWLGAGSPFMATAVIGGFVVGGWALGRSRALSQDLRRRVKDIDEHNRALDRVTRVNEERFEEVLQAKAEVELKVEERTRELRDATQKLSETLDEIQAVDRAKTDFFNNVSHELRSPLTLILAPLSDLVSGRVPAGGNAAAFETMHRNASRLLRLINQLLDLAKIDAGQMRIALTTVDIAAMLRSALTGFEAAATKKGVALSVHGADELAPIALDPAWIESAIANLVANALRLTPAGGSVRVSVEDRGGEVAISVADDGPGIAQKDLTRIFERFAQGDTATRVIGGTGIGLALVREAVRLHGGDVGVVSELGKGAVFTLTIPRRAAQPLERPQQGAASNSSRVPLLDELGEHAEALERSGPGPTAPLALVVEDNPELRVFIANVLAVRYRVRAVADGAQALASLAHVGPDVVVSDVAMPGMDGYALCRRLRADPRTSAVPVLLVTARTEEGSVLEGFEAGANDYVLKPFHGRELLARVDAHVRLRRMAQELVLRERHAMLGVLAASVAHQVRNPLTTLVSGLPAMKARLDGKVTPSTFDLIDLMMDCATRIERLTSDLVDLSRVDREEGGDFRPSDGLQSSIRMVKARLPHNVVIEDRVASSPIIRGRAGDVNHVFMNILDNAVRAVAGGGKVTVDAAIDGQAYVVRIADDGPGIEPSVAERIFEPFFTTRPAGEGTGLGLSIAQQVVQQCGGSIRVGRSRLGGAEFVIELPLVARADSQPALLAVAREALH